MDRIKLTILAALLISILCAPVASAQATAANISVVSGNGQMPCLTCGNKAFRIFYPLVVKVTDAAGNPLAGKTVSWQVTFATSLTPVVNPTSLTDKNGIASTTFGLGNQPGSASTAFLQSTVVASVDAVSTTFYETEALTDASQNQAQLVFSRIDSPPLGSLGYELSGPAGSTGTTPIIIHVDARGTPVPNVSVRLLNTDPKTTQSATCATQPGADPGSVLTDASGNGTCFPVFGPVPGNGGRTTILVGGLDPAQFDQSISPQPLDQPLAYDEYAGIILNVSTVTAAQIQVSAGNNQTLNPGQGSQALVVKVTDSTGAVPVGNTSVTWSVTPSATLTSTTTTTNAQGLAQNVITLPPGAAGTYTVKAALTSSPSVSTTFTVSTNIQIASLTKVSGEPQTIAANQPFPAPLVVQVNGTNGAPLPNVTVNFSINSNGTLSSSTGITDANGRAQVTVRAGGTAGTVTVTASVGSVSQTFTLTVIPPGPAVTTSSFVNAAGRNSALSPCSLATVLASGVAPGAVGLVQASNGFGPFPTTLANDTVTVNNVAAPILNVGTVNGQEQITFQIPCETAVGSAPVTVGVSGGTASANINLTAAAPGIFETEMSDKVRRAVVVRPDGTFVSLQNPARRGEVVRVFVTGLGPTTPPVGTGSLPVPGSDALVAGQVIVGVNNAGARTVTARLAPDLVGVYEVAFQVPTDAPAGNDVVLSVAVNAPGDNTTRFSNGSKLPIQ